MSRVRAIFNQWVTPTEQIIVGQVRDAADPVVLSHPDWFEPIPQPKPITTASPAPAVATVRVEPPAPKPEPEATKPEPEAKRAPEPEPPVERATAAPGERRATARPIVKPKPSPKQ